MLVDRKSRYTMIVKIRCKHTGHVHQKIKDVWSNSTGKRT